MTYKATDTADVSFDLTRERWLPVLRDGVATEVSLRDALIDAHRIDGLAPEVPTMLPVVLRHVLLPVVIDSHGLPASAHEWAELHAQGRLAADTINAHLDRHNDRFDLFHPTTPFAQVAGLAKASGKLDPAQLLVQTAPVGNNVPLFAAVKDGEPLQLTPAQAARWLLHTHSWDTAGIKSGAVGDPTVKNGKGHGQPGPLGRIGPVVPAGATLFDTLLLNIPYTPDGLPGGDAPWWRREHPDATWQEREATGLLDLLTWQTRRIRLHPSITADGDVVVDQVMVAAGDRLAVRPDWDPHTGWRLDSNNEPTPAKHRADRAVWAGLSSLLALPEHEHAYPTASPLLRQVGVLRGEEHLLADYPLRIHTCGIDYGNMQASIEHLFADQIPLPVVAMRRNTDMRATLDHIAATTGELESAVDKLDYALRKALGADPSGWEAKPSLQLLTRLDQRARHLLRLLVEHPDRTRDAEDCWDRIARAAALDIGRQLLDRIPPSAYTAGANHNGEVRADVLTSVQAAFYRRIDDAVALTEPIKAAGEDHR